MPGRPIWVGVVILTEDGSADTWQLNADDGPLQIRIEQEGIAFRGSVLPPEVLATLLVPTRIQVSGKARRWGPEAGSGSTFRMPIQPREITP